MAFWNSGNHRPEPPGIGLALSGGAVRGVAHVGVLKALQEADIPVGYISGTSIGAVVAALYAFEVPMETMLKQAEEMSWLDISSFTFSIEGLLSNRKIGEILEKHLGSANIEDAKIPLAIIATDIYTGNKVVLRKGDLGQAVMASSSIPGIFQPITIAGQVLVDGFLVENVPISPLRSMGAEVSVGVSLSTLQKYREPDSVLDILLNAYDIAIDSNTLITLQDADVLIYPRLSHIAYGDDDRVEKLFEEGHRSAWESIPKIRKALKNASKKRRFSLFQKIKRFFVSPA